MNDKNIIKFSKCCAHFYGVVTFTDIKNTIQHYNHETVDEVMIQEVLQTFVSKRTTIQIYKNFVYKTKAFNDMRDTERLYEKANIHEFYYPERKPDFFYFEASTYAEITYPHAKNLLDFLMSHIEGNERFLIADDICCAIATSFMVGYGPDHVFNQLFKEFNEDLFIKENEVHEFIHLLISAHNNTRRCDLRGFTPQEVQQGVKTQPYEY